MKQEHKFEVIVRLLIEVRKRKRENGGGIMSSIYNNRKEKNGEVKGKFRRKVEDKKIRVPRKKKDKN